MRIFVAAWLAAVCGIACGAPPRKPVVVPPPSPKQVAEAVGGVTDPALRAVISDYWEDTLRASPVWATTLGDHRYDDKLEAEDPAAIARRQDERDATLARLVALDASRLDDTDGVTLALLRGELEAGHALAVCKFEQWNIGAGDSSLFSALSYLVEAHVVTTPHDAENLIARMRQAPRQVDDAIANLKLGIASGRVASAEKLGRAIAQLDTELAKPVEQWAMAQPAWAKPPAPETWPAGERARLAALLHDIVAEQVRPSLVKLRAFFDASVLPNSRSDSEGLGGIPGGDACYRASILAHVGLAKTPEELHALGLSEIARTDRELAALGKKVLHTADLAATVAKLRGDRSLYFTSREELLAAAQHALDRAKAAIPKVFSVLPKADCVLREIPAHEAPYSTIAYYRAPNYDGSKPGEYFVNTYKPETRPKFELEALTWHESIPGHHLQIALAQELGALPMFRKLGGSTAFVEGWALYTERLAEDMGLYTSDLERIGKLSYDAWRASRLVVDTGIHAMGWTRTQAEGYMHDHTALTDVNISNEVDRYIGWPGQALAYKVGQLEILKLRAEAEARLGAKFDLKQFHAVVLGAGAVTLPVLDDRVRAWLAK